MNPNVPRVAASAAKAVRYIHLTNLAVDMKPNVTVVSQ